MSEDLIEITGTLAERPRAQIQPIGDAGDPRPVLKLVLQNCGVSNKRLTATQIFPVGAMAACSARATQLQPGMQVRVQAPASQIEWHMAEVAHIFTVQPQTQEQAHV